MHRGYWCGNAMERDHMEEMGLDESINWMLKK
jgi:hypothetical protein